LKFLYKKINKFKNMPEQKMQNSKSKIWILLVLVLVILLGVGGFFYWKNYLAKSNEQGGERSEPPRLFGKEDYRVEEREDGKYIVVDKVGLRAKVPEGWEVKFEGSDMPDGKSERWIDLVSPDFSTTTGNILKTGCIINLTAQTSKETYEEIKEGIQLLQENPDEAYKFLKQNYVLAENFNKTHINNYDALVIFSQEDALLGGGATINIPLTNYQFISFGLGFPLPYKEKCLKFWKDFLENIFIQ
jgi:hypothetical protein